MKVHSSKVPNVVQLIGKFWSSDTLYHICSETNCYTIEVMEITYMGDGGMQNTTYMRDGGKWYSITLKELKAFIACTLYMDLKKLPNVRYYWMRLEPFMYCLYYKPTIHKGPILCYLQVLAPHKASKCMCGQNFIVV